MVRYCQFCGGLLTDDSDFCNVCGASIEEKKEEKTQPVPQQPTIIVQQQQQQQQQPATPITPVVPIVIQQVPLSNSAADTSFWFGLLSWICIPIIGSIIAIIFGVIGLKKEYKKGLAIAGLTLGSVSLLGSVLLFIFLFGY